MKYRVKENNLYGGKYTIDQMNKWIENNPIEAQNTTFIDVEYTGGLLIPIFDDASNTWIESSSQADSENNDLQKEFNLYSERQSEGINRYLKLAAEFRLKKLNGDITDSFHKTIEETLRPVRDEFVNGQFITSKEKLEEIGSGVIGQQIYDQIHSSILEAINEFYI